MSAARSPRPTEVAAPSAITGLARLLSVLAVIAVLYTGYEIVEDIEFDQAARQRELEQTARGAADRVERYLSSWHKVFDTLADTRCVDNKQIAECSAVFSRIRQRNPDIVNLVALDRAGAIYGSALPLPTSPGGVTHTLPQFTEIAGGKARYLADPHLGPISRQQVAIFFARMSDSAGRFDGAMGVSFRLADLERQWALPALPDGVFIAIVNADNRILQADPAHAGWVGKSLAELAAGAVATPAALTLSDRGTRYSAHLTRLAPGEWGVLAVRPEPALATAILTSERLAFVFSLPVTLLALFGVTMARRARRAETARIRSEQELRRVFADTEHEVVRRTRELAHSEALYHTLFDQSPVGIVLLDAAGTILDCNRSATTLSAYSRAEMVGMNITQLDAAMSASETLQRVAAMIDGDGAQFETLSRRKDGSVYPVLVNAQPINAPEDETRRLLVFWSDLSEINRDQERQRYAQKMEAVGVLAGGVAHDFNNLLAIVMGHAQLAHDAAAAESPIRSYTQKIIKAGLRARAIVKQLLDFSRNTDEAPRAMSLVAELDEIRMLLEVSVPRHIVMRFSVESDISAIYAVPHQVQQVVINIINNACDAIGQQPGEVDVSLNEEIRNEELAALVGTLRPGRYVVLRIRDSGPGISETVLPQIFLPFFSTKEVGRGTGLGLAVVRGIMESLGGAVTVITRPAGGCSFELFFPVTQASPLLPVITPVSGQGFGELVMVVDDEPEVVEAYLEYLRDAGFVPLFAPSGEDALALARTHGSKLRAVLSDLLMPLMDGLTLADRLREELPGLPVLLLTGRGEKLQARDLENCGVAGLISKPAEPQIVASELRRVIDAAARQPG